MRGEKLTVEEIVSRLRPIDDIFFHKLVEKEGFCEELLQTILEKDTIRLVEVVPQKSLRNIGARSVTIDAFCEDSYKKYYNIEVQRKNNDNHQNRVRYNGSNIDTYITEKGIKYKNLPESYVIYISEFDMFDEGETIYHIIRSIKETKSTVYNGYNEIYVNTLIDDGSDIAELMKIFKSSSIPNNKKFPRICEAIKAIKEEKGSGDMCKIVEDYGNIERRKGKREGRREGKREGRREGKLEAKRDLIINLMKTMNVSMSQSMDMLLIPEEEREKYLELM